MNPVPLNAFLIDSQPQYSQLDPEDLLIDRERLRHCSESSVAVSSPILRSVFWISI